MKLFALASLIFAAVAIAQEAVEHVEVAAEVEAVAEEGEAGAFLVEGDDLVKIPTGRRPRCPRYKSCSSSSSSSSDCESSSSCCGQCNKVFYDYMDFYTSKPVFSPFPAVATWEYWQATLMNPNSVQQGGEYYIADQGAWSTGCNGGLLTSTFMDANVFAAQTFNTTVDHAKYFAFSSTPIPVPTHGDVVVKWRASVSTAKTEDNPFPSSITERNDFRLASGRFITFDSNTGLEFSFVLTNNRVYVLYQRNPPALEIPAAPEPVPIAKAGTIVNAGYAAFTFVIPVKIRRPCDFHDMGIVLHGDTKMVSWHLDGREVMLISKPGFLLDRDYLVNDLGGAEIEVFPTQIQYGYGTFTGLDWYPACQRSASCDRCAYPNARMALVDVTSPAGYIQYNPIFGTSQNAVFYNNNGIPASAHAWNQTVTMKLHKLVAYQKVPVCKK